MTAPIVVSSAYFPWTAAYPLASSNTFDSTGCDGLLVFFFTNTGASWTPPPSCTYKGQTGTLIGQSYVSSQTSAGTLYAWIIRGFTTGSGTVSISQSSNHANSDCAYYIGLSGTQATPIGNYAVHVSSAASDTSSINASGSDSLFVTFGGDAQAPSITVTPPSGATLLLNNTTATDNLGKVHSVTGISSGAAVSITSTAPYNYTSSAVIEVLGSDSGGSGGGTPPSVTLTTNLSLAIALGAVTMRAPHIDANPLTIIPALGTVVLSAPHIEVGALSLTLNLPPIAIAVTGLLHAPSLSINLGLGTGELTSPPVVFVNPLNLSLLLGSGSIETPVQVYTDPLFISLVQAAGEIRFLDPISIMALPLKLSWDRIPKPYACPTKPLAINIMIGRQLSPLSVVVG